MAAPFQSASSIAVPTEEEMRLARDASIKLLRHLRCNPDKPLQISFDGDETTNDLQVSASVGSALLEILSQIGRGNAIYVMPLASELTTHQAADILKVSETYVVKLLDEEVIPSYSKGTRRWVLLRDLLVYKYDNEQKRHQALDELTAQAQELNMGY